MSLQGKKIAVLQGGPGSERQISLASAVSVSQALREEGAEVTEVDVTGTEVDIPAGTELAFNVIHGTFGEDGQLQDILERMGVPYTGAGSASSRLAFDKIDSKKRFIEHGVITPAYEFCPAPGGAPTLPLPMVIKPPREGSSVGVHIVKETGQIAEAMADVGKYGDTALVEAFVEGKELTVGVLDDEALPIVHIAPKSGWYDISNKYPWLSGSGGDSGSNYYCPAELPEEVTRYCQEQALKAHRSLGIEIYSRVDLLLDADNKPYVLEVNTIPGMTETSLLPKAALAHGISFAELCSRIALLSLQQPRT